jgi:hypothetical protein
VKVLRTDQLALMRVEAVAQGGQRWSADAPVLKLRDQKVVRQPLEQEQSAGERVQVSRLVTTGALLTC